MSRMVIDVQDRSSPAPQRVVVLPWAIISWERHTAKKLSAMDSMEDLALLAWFQLRLEGGVDRTVEFDTWAQGLTTLTPVEEPPPSPPGEAASPG